MIGNTSISSSEIQEKTDRFSLNSFDATIENYASKLGNVSTSEALQELILHDYKNLIQDFINLAEEVFKININSENIVDPIFTFQVNYQIPENLKNLSILHRDVLLELQKAEITSKEKEINSLIITGHLTKSKEILISALEHFEFKLESIEVKKNDYKNKVKQITKSLTLQSNPWEIYKEQFEALQNQFGKIDCSKARVIKTIGHFKKIRGFIDMVQESNDELNDSLDEKSKFVQKSLATQNEIPALIHYMDDGLELFQSYGVDLTKINESLQTEIDELYDLNIPVSANDGILQYREVHFSREVQKWFDYQILPNIMELISQENNIKEKVRVTFINLKNSIHLSKNSEKHTSTEVLTNTINRLISEISTNRHKNKDLTNKINNKIVKELMVSRLYQDTTFLNVPLNTTFSSSVNLSKHTLYTELKRRSQKIYSFFNRRYEQSNYLDTFSDIEITTKCIAHRMLKQENEHYDILFLNKNFIGDLFLVKRTLQEDKLKEAISQWNSGFNKASLIYGDRLSGRSTFLESTSRNYFGKDIVTLKPNSLSTIDGRKFATSFDLKEALGYVKNNNSKSTRPVILIDDLELWRDEDHSLLNNIRALINFIETESDDAFIMVSTSLVLKNQLDKRLGFSNVFSTLIDLSKMGSNEILQALLLRHGAAHRTLITEDGSIVSEKTIEKTALKLSKKYNYNVGDVLQAWTYNTYVQESEDVLFKPEEFEFLDFFTQQEFIILKQALLFRSISEIGLKRVTGLSFEQDFRSAIRRLINTKILIRGLKGSLNINPVVLQDVTQLLIKKRYLINSL